MTKRTIIPVEQRKPRVRKPYKRKPRDPTLQQRNEAFHAMMWSALRAGHERLPAAPVAPDDRAIPRPFAPGQVFTSSNCTGF